MNKYKRKKKKNGVFFAKVVAKRYIVETLLGFGFEREVGGLSSRSECHNRDFRLVILNELRLH